MKLEEIGTEDFWMFLEIKNDFLSSADFAGSDSQMERPGDLDAEKVPFAFWAFANHPNPCGSHMYI